MNEAWRKLGQLKQYAYRFYHYGSEEEYIGIPLITRQDGLEVGCLEKVYLSNFNLYAEGWTRANALRIRSKGNVTVVRPYAVREEKNKAGFQVMVNRTNKLELDAELDGKWLECEKIGLASYGRRVKTSLNAFKQAAKLLVKCPGAVFRYLLFRDEKAIPEIKIALQRRKKKGFVRIMHPAIFDKGEEQVGLNYDGAKVCIIIPVYNALESLQQCLTQVVRHSDLSYRLVVIEDHSTDERVRPWLRRWIAEQTEEITLLENDKNIGFIASVNRGLAAAGEENVVLLNTDAFVPKKWLSRIMRSINKDSTVASVTPMSNDAEICSVPVIGREYRLLEGQAKRIDRVACELNPEIVCKELPTGVGFCMALSAKYLKMVGGFDRAFEPGYGEEVDWCQKAVAMGGRNVGLGNLFVEHRGAQSFGSASKTRQIEKNSSILNNRYSSYISQVAEFIRCDPLAEARMILAIAYYAFNKPLKIYFAHTYGGGSERYLKQRIAEDVQARSGVAVVRIDPVNCGYSLTLHGIEGTSSIIIKDACLLREVLALAEKKHFVYSALAGLEDAPGLLADILELYVKGKDELTFLFHDYYPLCPSFTLLNDQGRYCSLPGPENCSVCYQNLPAARAVKVASIAEWREHWGRLLALGDQILVFSEDSQKLVTTVYPSVEKKVKVKPHQLDYIPEKVRPKTLADELVIGVLGTVVYHKGAHVLNNLAALIDGRKKRIVVFGDLDPRYAQKNLELHGPYRIEEISLLAEHYRLTCWFIPSIWPETFSYTTHEALATGLPVIGFDIGAQGEVLRKAPTGFTLDLRIDESEYLLNSIEAIVKERSLL